VPDIGCISQHGACKLAGAAYDATATALSIGHPKAAPAPPEVPDCWRRPPVKPDAPNARVASPQRHASQTGTDIQAVPGVPGTPTPLPFLYTHSMLVCTWMCTVHNGHHTRYQYAYMYSVKGLGCCMCRIHAPAQHTKHWWVPAACT
jgi:hypothetical protein